MKKIKKMFRYENVGILFVFPAFLYMLIFVGYPIIRNIILSFQDVGAGNLVRGTKNFIMFDNYLEGSVFNFVSLPFHLIPEAGCGRSPRALINAGFSVNFDWLKNAKEEI